MSKEVGGWEKESNKWGVGGEEWWQESFREGKGVGGWGKKLKIEVSCTCERLSE